MVSFKTVDIKALEDLFRGAPSHLQEAMATSEELGQDLEHVELLQKKFEEFQTDLAAHEERVNEVNQLATKLIQEAHPEAELIVRKQDEVNSAWQRLKGLAQQRQAKLFGAAEVQRFNRCVLQSVWPEQAAL